MLCCAESLSHVRLFATPWTVAHQAPLSMGILQARILDWVAIFSSTVSSWPRDRTWISHIAGGFFTIWASREAHTNSQKVHEKMLNMATIREVKIKSQREITLHHLEWLLWKSKAIIRERNGNPLQYSCLENSMDRGAWWATVHGVAKSQAQLSN